MKRRDLIAGSLALSVSGVLSRQRAMAAEAETKAGEPLVLGGHIGPISQLAYSPDGRWLVASARQPGNGGETRLWDARTGKLERVLLPDIEGQRMQWTPDGRTLALPGMRWHDGGGTGSVQLWDTSSPDVEKWAARCTLDEASASAISTLSPDGKYFLTGLQNREGSGAMVWEVQSGESAARLGEQSGFLAAATFAPDGQSLFTLSWKGEVNKFAGTALQWWDTRGVPGSWELARVLSVPQRLGDAKLSPDGKRLAWVRWKDDMTGCTLVISDAHRGETQHEIPSESWLWQPRWSPDGKSLAVSHVTGAMDRQNARPQADIFETQSWKLTATLGNVTRMIAALAFSPDGKSLALGSGENAVEIYKL